MSQSVADKASSRHAVSLDAVKPTMAKVNAHSVGAPWPLQIGGALNRACRRVWLSNKEAADAIGVDYADFGKWLDGTRRLQLDKCLAVPELREPLLVELAKLLGWKEDVTLKKEIA